MPIPLLLKERGGEGREERDGRERGPAKGDEGRNAGKKSAEWKWKEIGLNC